MHAAVGWRLEQNKAGCAWIAYCLVGSEHWVGLGWLLPVDWLIDWLSYRRASGVKWKPLKQPLPHTWLVWTSWVWFNKLSDARSSLNQLPTAAFGRCYWRQLLQLVLGSAVAAAAAVCCCSCCCRYCRLLLAVKGHEAGKQHQKQPVDCIWGRRL